MKTLQIDPKQYERLMTLNDKKLAAQQYLEGVTMESRRLLQEINEETRKVWQDIAAAHKLDLELTDWTPLKEKNIIGCIQERHR